jgi:hypothetical protein
LTFALDQSVTSSAPPSLGDGEIDDPATPKKPAYGWQAMRGETGFAAVLLERRKAMLKLNLTESQVLQFEWVELVRELEKLAYRSPVHTTLQSPARAGASPSHQHQQLTSSPIPRRRSQKDRSHGRTSRGPDHNRPHNSFPSPSLLTPSSSHESIPRNPAISRILFSDTPRDRDASYSDLYRATSMASFYSGDGSDGFVTCEDFYSQADSTDFDADVTDDDLLSQCSFGSFTPHRRARAQHADARAQHADARAHHLSHLSASMDSSLESQLYASMEESTGGIRNFAQVRVGLGCACGVGLRLWD